MIRPPAISAIVVLAVACTSCWTVRPIESRDGASETAATLSPAAYVNALWSSKLLPAVENSAVDARTFLDAYGWPPMTDSAIEKLRRKYGR